MQCLVPTNLMNPNHDFSKACKISRIWALTAMTQMLHLGYKVNWIQRPHSFSDNVTVS